MNHKPHSALPAGLLQVPLVDLARGHQAIQAELESAFRAELKANQLILGSVVQRFEEAFAAYCGVPHAVGVACGLDALRLALQASGVTAGDEVILAANAFPGSALAVRQVLARPVLVDCEPEALTLPIQSVRAAITPRTRAILAVDLYGRLEELRALEALSAERGLALVEDAAQAHGARIDGRMAGSFGRAGCFSFYPSKNLGALGDGGCITTQDAELASHLRTLRQYGWREKYRTECLGWNSRLDSLQAAWLLVKLRYLDKANEARRGLARRYDDALGGMGIHSARPPRAGGDGQDHVHHLYPILVPPEDRNRIRADLDRFGIETAVHYPLPVHLQPAFADLGYQSGDFPNAERAAKSVLSLPLFPELTLYEQDRVIEALRTVLASR